MVTKSVNIDYAQGFPIKIHEIQYFDQSLENDAGDKIPLYTAKVAVICGDTGIVIIYLNSSTSTDVTAWPMSGDFWSAEDEGFQQYVESQYESFQFLKRLVDECGLENTKEWLQEHSTENSD